jgi:hypothetical protein
MRTALFCLLLAPLWAFCDEPPVKLPPTRVEAVAAWKSLVEASRAGAAENAMLRQQLTGAIETKDRTQAAALDTQAAITKLTKTATDAVNANLTLQAKVEEKTLEAHNNAKERDVFLFTLSAISTILIVGGLKGPIQALSNPWLQGGAWIITVLSSFGVSYTVLRWIVALFAKMIP